MDTAENELQALRKEFDTLREENFALYKDLSTQNELLLEQIITLRQENFALCKELAQHHVVLRNTIKFFWDSRYDALNNCLWHLARMQTAEFLIKNMVKVKTFNNKESYLEYILNQTSDAFWGDYIWSLASLRAEQ